MGRSFNAAVFVALAGILASLASSSPASAGTNHAAAVRGTVTTRHGTSVARARVTIYAWPSTAAMKAQRKGQALQLRPVGHARASVSGSYSIRLAGTGNYLVRAWTRQATGIWNVSGGGQRTADVRLTGAASPYLCIPQETLVKTWNPAPGVVGTSYSRYAGIKQWFTYGSNQSSSIGVGLSSSGDVGSFTFNGSASYSSGTSQTWGSHSSPYSVKYRTDFVPAEYSVSCGGGYLAKPKEWAGGATVDTNTSPPNATYCVWYDQNTTFTKQDTTAFTFSAGFTTGGLGFTGSAQTGFDTNAELHYDMVNAGMNLCGTDNYPAGSSPGPKRIVAGKP